MNQRNLEKMHLSSTYADCFPCRYFLYNPAEQRFSQIYCVVDIGNPEMIHSVEVTHKILLINQLFILET